MIPPAAVPLDIVESRHRRILELARRTGSVSVDELARQLAVTPQTIRKDLTRLSRHAMLSRIHGGAIITSGTDNIAYPDRRLVASDAKRAIGASVAALIPDGASLFITIGTTAEAIAQHLRQRRDLMVVTNNLNVVDILADSPTIETIVAGGRMRRADRAIVGALAMEFIANFRVDFAVIGASALEADGTFFDFDIEEVRVAQAIMRQARRRILALDGSKLGRPAPVRIGHVSDIDVLVMDRIDDPELAAACAAAGVQVVAAGD